jgi:hypothetical protein
VITRTVTATVAGRERYGAGVRGPPEGFICENVRMSVVTFGDLPLADRRRRWNGDAAERRVRRWAQADDGPNERYRRAFVWYDAANKDNFGSYKLQIADVIRGRLTAVPRGVFAAAAVMQGSRGGVDLPRKEIGRVKSHLTRYYKKMDETPPWDQD